MEKQVSLSTRVGGLGFFHGLNSQSAEVVAAWTNLISTIGPFGDCALESLQRGLIRASANYGWRPTREVNALSENATDAHHFPSSSRGPHHLEPTVGHSKGLGLITVHCTVPN